MPAPYVPVDQAGNRYSVPDYAEAADGPAAFKAFADSFQYMLPPIGSMQPFVGDTAPQGWLLCDGAEHDQTTFPRLSAMCGTKFGAAVAGKFKVPDLRGRVIAGVNTGDSDFSTIGKTGGAKQVSITTSNLPVHTHAVTGSVTVNAASPSHSHAGSTDLAGNHDHGGVVTGGTTGNNTSTGGGAARITAVASGRTGQALSHAHSYTTSAATTAHSHTASMAASASSGGGVGSPTALPIVQPYISLKYIIRADI